jgi:hypothetical protein
MQIQVLISQSTFAGSIKFESMLCLTTDGDFLV